MENRSVAIDGPAGAGKSTLAKMAAREFGFIYVDTGALYRCVGLFALKNGVGSRDAAGIEGLLSDMSIEMRHDENGVQIMLLNNVDVTDDIRTPEVSVYASDVSAIPAVRDFLFSQQKEMAEKYNVVMDGRDIGTVVLPGAGLKVFLTATPEVRAMRRYKELAEKGVVTTYDEVLAGVNERDYNDSHREVAPLKPAADSVLLDTSDIDLDESFKKLCSIIREKLQNDVRI